jgi:hypothetical protein
MTFALASNLLVKSCDPNIPFDIGKTYILLGVMTMFLCSNGTKHNDVNNIAFGKIQVCQNPIHHPLEFCKCILEPDGRDFH